MNTADTAVIGRAHYCCSSRAVRGGVGVEGKGGSAAGGGEGVVAKTSRRGGEEENDTKTCKDSCNWEQSLLLQPSIRRWEGRARGGRARVEGVEGRGRGGCAGQNTLHGSTSAVIYRGILY